MIIQPLEDRVLVKPAEAATETKGGVRLPINPDDHPASGEVIAIGNGRMVESGHRVNMTVKEGDTVLYPKYGGGTIIVDDVEYKMFKESELLGLVKGE